MLIVKDFLKCLDKREFVEILDGTVSDGAYTVNELLKKEIPSLDKTIPENSVRIFIEEAEGLVAMDSVERDEFFPGSSVLPYIRVDLNEYPEKQED